MKRNRMNIPVRKTLAMIYRIHGNKLLAEPWLTEGLLRDHCPGHDSAVKVLVAAQREGVPQHNISLDYLYNRLVKKMRKNCYITEIAALWAIDPWVNAFQGNNDELTVKPIVGQVGHFIVSKHKKGNVLKIKDALDNSGDGMQIRVMKGVYEEHFSLKRNAEIIGVGHAEDTIIKGIGGVFLRKTGCEVTLSNLCIEGLNEYDCIEISAGKMILNNVIIRCNVFVHGYNAHIEMHNCHFEPNENTYFVLGNNSKSLLDHVIVQGSMKIKDFSHSRMSNCSFYNQIECSEYSKSTFNKCKINAPVLVSSQAKSIFRECTFYPKRFGGITIIHGSCQLLNSEMNEYPVAAGENTVLTVIESNISGKDRCGITINKNACGVIEDTIINGSQQSGLTIHDNASVKMNRCLVEHINGNGINIYSSRPFNITSSEIRNCEKTGIEIHSQARLICSDCHIHHNLQGISLNKNQHRFQNCEITNNSINLVKR